MERVERLVTDWNDAFPNHPLASADLKKPHALMSALFELFDRLGIDRDAILAPPPEEMRNKSLQYYWDILPVINMVRVTKHLVSVMPAVSTVTIAQFLQPAVGTSHSLLLLLFNLMVFNDMRLQDIKPHENKLFQKTEQVKALEEMKHKMKEMLNKQAQEKGKRADRLERLDYEIQQLEEELKQEKELHDEEKQELDVLIKENHQTNMVLEQKKTQRDAILDEVERKKALRVYDADDIKAQAEQASQNVQEVEEKLDSLRTMLMEKENSLKNLQTIKPSLDTANNLLHEIMKLSESLKDLESGDLDSESKEGEMDVLNMELSELQAQMTELRAARAELTERRQEHSSTRQQEKTELHSALHEAEEKDRKAQERSKKAAQRIEDIKNNMNKYEEEKSKGMEELVDIKNNFENDLKLMGETLLKKTEEMSEIIDKKLQKLNI